MAGKNAYFGWRPDVPDIRDHVMMLPRRMALPRKVDLRPRLPVPAYDQGAIGSCTAQAIAGAIQFSQNKQSLPLVTPSRLFVYYNERALEGSINEDSGATIRSGFKTINSEGACPEKLWPYKPAVFTRKPSKAAYASGKKQLAVKYQRLIRSLAALKGCIATAGYPFVFGFSVYASFETPAVERTGMVPVPKSSEEMMGGHAVLAVGYDDTKKAFLVRNSWGTDWAIDGHFYLPYAFFVDGNLSDDFWALNLVS